jgi:IPT/TIG domain
MGISPGDWKMTPPPNPDPSARPAIDDVWPNKGPESGGQRVQIRGRNLQPVLVLFGRSPAQILGVSESDGDVVLTLVAPPRTGPAQVWIVVANSDGSNAVGQFEYYR